MTALRVRRRLDVELLEGRWLLATLDINSSVSPTELTYTATPLVANDLTITVATVGGTSSYTFNDTGEPINLGQGAIAAGWVAVNANTVTGPTASVGTMVIDTMDEPDTVNIDQTDAPITIAATDGGSKSVNIGNGTTSGINGTITIDNQSALTGVTVNDSADPNATSSILSMSTKTGALQGLTPQGIFFTPSLLTTLTLQTGTAASSLTVDYSGGDPLPPEPGGLVLDGGAGRASLLLEGNKDLPISAETLTATGKGAGMVELSGSEITFSGLSQLLDTLTVPTFTFNDTIGGDNVALSDGPVVGGLATGQIATSGSFPSAVANKSVVNVDAQSGSTVGINSPTPAAGLAELNVSAPQGPATVDLDARPAGVDTSISFDTGATTANIATAGLMNAGSTSVSGGTGTTTMTYDANGNAVSFGPDTIAAGSGTTARQTTVTFLNVNTIRVVNSPDLPLTATPATITTNLGTAFTNATVATFVDSDTRSTALDFNANINWGDGTAPTAGTVVAAAGGGFMVLGSHTYATAGTFAVVVTINDLGTSFILDSMTGPVNVFTPGGATATADSTAIVNPPPPSGLVVVNTLDDDNPGSLRYALNAVDQGLDSVVTFDIPGPAPYTITPATPLPTITRPATVDATTQPGYQGQPLVVVNGSKLSGTDGDGLTVDAGNTTLKGLVINGFSNVGVVLENAGGDTLENDYIGTDASGSSAVPNYQGVLILGTSGNTIGGTAAGAGNVISGNTAVGVQILNNLMVTDPTQPFAVTGTGSGNSLLGNMIGTNAAGTATVPNGQGVFVNDAPGNTVGGSASGAGNVISGNRSVGLQILGANATGNQVLGNAIGTDLTHSLHLGNGSGVLVFAAAGNDVDQSNSSAGNSIEFNTAFNFEFRPLSDGPTVGTVVATPVGGSAIDGLTVTFSIYMDSTRVSNTANYVVQVLGRNNRPLKRIKVVSASYNGIYRTVDLVLAKPIAVGATFSLRIRGMAPGGLTDSSGNFLAGNTSAFRLSSGADNVTVFRHGQAVVTPAARAVNKTHSARPAPRG